MKAERDALLDKLERAKEALEPFAELRAGRFMPNGCRYNYRIDVAWIRNAQSVLAEMGADE